jgi:hypothetical protein
MNAGVPSSRLTEIMNPQLKAHAMSFEALRVGGLISEYRRAA